MTLPPALSLTDLTVSYRTATAAVTAVQEISLEIRRGEILALLGGAGSGKSTIALASMRLLPATAQWSGRIAVGGDDIGDLPRKALDRLRGARIGMIFQESMSSLNPVLTIERQLVEGIVAHQGLSPASARVRALDALREIGIADPERVMLQYPHQLSGGMRQRAMIAAVLALQPDVVIADEPTTALDVATRSAVMDLFDAARHRQATGILLITHDLDVVARTADRVAVLEAGRVVELGEVRSVLTAPKHHYTQRLLASRVTLSAAAVSGVTSSVEAGRPPRLAMNNVSRRFSVGRRQVDALRGVSLMLREGETLGIVGESGAGKTTVGRIAAGLDRASGGELTIAGVRVPNRPSVSMHRPFLHSQMIFQDPNSSLNPRLTAARQLSEPVLASGLRDRGAVRARVIELFQQVGLDPHDVDRYPHEFSGGQRQRIAIARALAANPQIIIADEPVSSLDTIIQGQILDLLKEVGQRNNISYLFISHDLAAVARMSETIAVMQQGCIVETGPTQQIITDPTHPYTRALLEVAPRSISFANGDARTDSRRS